MFKHRNKLSCIFTINSIINKLLKIKKIMKTTFKLFMFLLATSAIAVSCGSNAEQADVSDAQEVAEATGGTNYMVTDASSITWKGEKFSGDAHNGTIGLTGGEFTVEDGNITAGNFTIDMKSIAVTDDMPEDKKGYLVGHLAGTTGSDKDADFFQVTKYPTAKFEVTEVKPVTKEGATHEVSGNLTMLDKTNKITFDANVSTDGNTLTATTEPFAFDRTKWGITFMSTLAGMAKEAALRDDIIISIDLKATAAE